MSSRRVFCGGVVAAIVTPLRGMLGLQRGRKEETVRLESKFMGNYAALPCPFCCRAYIIKVHESAMNQRVSIGDSSVGNRCEKCSHQLYAIQYHYPQPKPSANLPSAFLVVLLSRWLEDDSGCVTYKIDFDRKTIKRLNSNSKEQSDEQN